MHDEAYALTVYADELYVGDIIESHDGLQHSITDLQYDDNDETVYVTIYTGLNTYTAQMDYEQEVRICT